MSEQNILYVTSVTEDATININDLPLSIFVICCAYKQREKQNSLPLVWLTTRGILIQFITNVNVECLLLHLSNSTSVLNSGGSSLSAGCVGSHVELWS